MVQSHSLSTVHFPLCLYQFPSSPISFFFSFLCFFPPIGPLTTSRSLSRVLPKGKSTWFMIPPPPVSLGTSKMVLPSYFKNLELLAPSVQYRDLRSILKHYKSQSFFMNCLILGPDHVVQVNVKGWSFVVMASDRVVWPVAARSSYYSFIL
jgi:hypothetical protein